MILVTLLLNIISFVGLHNYTKFVDRYPNGWRQITSYCIGVVFTLPFFALYNKLIGYNKHRSTIAYLLAFTGSGIGTALGWMYKDFKDDHKNNCDGCV